MAKMIFVNLPVTDLARATAFYETIGAVKNPQFSGDTASCMVFSETIHCMLLTHNKYNEFQSKKIADTRTTSAVLLCLSADSRSEVDGVFDKVAAAGGIPDPEPKHDDSFMYGRCFYDPDGHAWQLMWMDDAEAFQTQPAAENA